MRKRWIFLLLVFISCSMIFSQTITVDDPKAGVTWCKGNAYVIRWTKSGTMPDQVRIWLRNSASTQTVLVISDQTDNDGQHPWTVPASLADGSYRIRVVTGGGTIWGDSGIFTIGTCAQGSIAVQQPDGGKPWCKGLPYKILWTTTGQTTSTVRINLLNAAATSVVKFIEASAPNTGSYEWKIPADIPTGSYRIRVRTAPGGAIDVWGDSPVFIINTCKMPIRIYYIDVKEPHYKVHWDGGETRNIEWESNYTRDIKIQLYNYNGKTLIRDITGLRTFPTSGANKYYFAWGIPTDISPGSYIIRISNQTNTVKGASKNFFIRQKLVTRTYMVPVGTSNKYRQHTHDSRTNYPIVGKEFVSSISEYPDPGADKIRVGFQNYYHSGDYHQHYIYRSFLGVNVEAYKNKGFFLKATLEYVPTPHISQPAAQGPIRLFYLDEAWNGTWEHLFNINASELSGSTNVTAVVRDWLLGTSPNYGFLMVGPNEMMQNNSDFCIYTSSKVMLKLEFLEQQ